MAVRWPRNFTMWVQNTIPRAKLTGNIAIIFKIKNLKTYPGGESLTKVSPPGKIFHEFEFSAKVGARYGVVFVLFSFLLHNREFKMSK